MAHTYEVLVDIKAYDGQSNSCCQSLTRRYEIEAESRRLADNTAKLQARNDYPQATEYDPRVTRFLK